MPLYEIDAMRSHVNNIVFNHISNNKNLLNLQLKWGNNNENGLRMNVLWKRQGRRDIHFWLACYRRAFSHYFFYLALPDLKYQSRLACWCKDIPFHNIHPLCSSAYKLRKLEAHLLYKLHRIYLCLLPIKTKMNSYSMLTSSFKS